VEQDMIIMYILHQQHIASVGELLINPLK
jgi:hypothetical protein